MAITPLPTLGDAPTTAPPVPELLAAVDARTRAMLDAEARRWAPVDPRLAQLVDRLGDFVAAGGKRLRPAFCAWGAVGAGGELADPALAATCAALELLHAFALIHDDVMDGAATRRGRPSVHETFARDHHREQWLGEARRFGEGMGVLLGDLALVCAERELVDVATPVRVLWHEMQIELTMGQSLDLVSTAARDRDGRVARSIAILKSGRYTVTRPLQLGAAVAGRLDELAAPYAAIGDPLGEAFQLRDDLLGVFGDPARTGKPVGSDLTEGKATPLAAIAATRCRGREQALLARIGAPDLRPDEVDALCTLLETSGARAAVEHRVRRLGRRALDAIADAPIPPAARAGLRDLARRTLWRES